VVLGLAGQMSGNQGFWEFSSILAPFGTLWFNALQMAVIPLVVTQLLTALVRKDRDEALGVLGGKTVGLFLTLMVAAGAFTMFLVPVMLGAFEAPVGWGDALSVGPIPAAAQAAADAPRHGFGDWLVGLVPRNPLAAAANGNLIQILVFTVLMGLAISRLEDEQRAPLADLFRTLADAMMVLVSWILIGTPFAVFSLFLSLSLENGIESLGLIGVYILVVAGALLAVSALLYPFTAALGRISLKDFAKAAAPAQIVAVSTQSSLASLPAMILGGKEHARLPQEGTGFVLPLCVSAFKLNQAVSPLAKLIFLAFAFGIPLSLADQATFLVGAIVLSFGVPGVPRGAPFMTLPLFLALGIPIEGIILLEAVKTIPDVFMTLTNVTADMSVATVLTRSARERKASTPAPATQMGSD